MRRSPSFLRAMVPAVCRERLGNLVGLQGEGREAAAGRPAVGGHASSPQGSSPDNPRAMDAEASAPTSRCASGTNSRSLQAAARSDKARELVAERYVLDAMPLVDMEYDVVTAGDFTLIDRREEILAL